MITEIYINVVLKPYTPLGVIKTLHAVCNSEVEELGYKPSTWVHMFDGSAKRNNKWCTLTYLSELNQHHLVGIGSTEESVDDDDAHAKVSESGRQAIFKKHQSQFLRKFSLLEI